MGHQSVYLVLWLLHTANEIGVPHTPSSFLNRFTRFGKMTPEDFQKPEFYHKSEHFHPCIYHTCVCYF